MRLRAKVAAAISAWSCIAMLAIAQPQRPSPAPNSSMKPAMLKDTRIEQKLNTQLPLELTFRNESGETGPLGRYFRNKPVILALVYYECPMLCNMTLNGLVRSLRDIALNRRELE